MEGADGGADDDKYIAPAAIKQTFGISSGTLRNWAEAGRVGVVRMGPTGKRLYRRSDVAKAFQGYQPATAAARQAPKARTRVCYARVSSAKQRGDLERQVQALQARCPEHEIVRDVASGINWKRPGLLSLLDRAMRGDVCEVVVSHRDRLCRFAFDLLERVLHNAGCRIVVLDKEEEDGKAPSGGDGGPSGDASESELRDDLLAIVTVFVASNNGRRAAANRRTRQSAAGARPGEAQAREEAKAREGPNPEGPGGATSGEAAGGQVHDVEDLPGPGPEVHPPALVRDHPVDLQPGGGPLARH